MYHGIHAVLYALFQQDERIDPEAMRAQVTHCVAHGCDGITVLGLATEVLKLSFAERRQMIEIVGAALGGARPYSVTIAGNSVAEQSEMARIAAANGADWLILQPPLAGNYDAEVYLDFLARVAQNTDLPVALQNAPQYLGRGLSAQDIASLRSRCPNLAAIKAEDGAETLAPLVAAGDGLAVLGGRGGQELIACLQAGATGFVLAPDIAPVAGRILAHWQAGRIDDAQRLYAAATPAIDFAMQSLEHLIAYGKRIFAEQAGLPVHDRAPALVPTPADLERAQHWAATLADLEQPKM